MRPITTAPICCTSRAIDRSSIGEPWSAEHPAWARQRRHRDCAETLSIGGRGVGGRPACRRAQGRESAWRSTRHVRPARPGKRTRPRTGRASARTDARANDRNMPGREAGSTGRYRGHGHRSRRRRCAGLGFAARWPPSSPLFAFATSAQLRRDKGKFLHRRGQLPEAPPRET